MSLKEASSMIFRRSLLLSHWNTLPNAIFKELIKSYMRFMDYMLCLTRHASFGLSLL